MIPQPVPRLGEATAGEVCAFRNKWLLHPTLLDKLMRAQAELPFGLKVRQGHRTRAEYEALKRAGRPVTPTYEMSTHAQCPSQGADMDIEIAVTNVTKALFGSAIVRAGLRWGGRSDGGGIDPETGIPYDWNHVDMGPVSRG